MIARTGGIGPPVREDDTMALEERMTEELAKEYYKGGIDCSQIVFAHAAALLDMDEEEALKIAAAFGGGMMNGERCGCVTGALMALGAAYGHFEPGDAEAKQKMMERKAEFERRFKEHEITNGSLICREILGHKIPEEMPEIMQKNLLMQTCPKLAVIACDLLDEMIE